MLRIAILVLIIAAASVSASMSDRWPGDLDGARLLQGMVNGTTEPVLNVLNALGATKAQVTLSAGSVMCLMYLRQRRQAAFLLMAIFIAGITT